MSIPIVRIIRKIVVGLTPGLKFLVRPKKRKAIGFEVLAERIQAHSSLTKADAFAAMLQMEHEVLEEIKEGNPVNLGKLGTFTPTFSSKAVDTLEEATEKTIIRKFLRYTPTKFMRDIVKNIPVELDKTHKIKGLQTGETEDPIIP